LHFIIVEISCFILKSSSDNFSIPSFKEAGFTNFVWEYHFKKILIAPQYCQKDAVIIYLDKILSGETNFIGCSQSINNDNGFLQTAFLIA
jgi:hypothetical protein